MPSVCGCCGRLLMCSDALPPQLLLELRLPAPRRVLPPLVGQDLPRRAVLRDAARPAPPSPGSRAGGAPARSDTMYREWSSMNAARYSRSCRRSRNVKMSDCQSWFGSARSKRRGRCSRLAPGSARLAAAPPRAGSAAPRSPTPRAPRSAPARRGSAASPTPGAPAALVTASRFTSAPRRDPVSGFRFPRTEITPITPSAPRSRYRSTQPCSVVSGIPRTSDSVVPGTPSSTTARAIFRRTSGLHSRLPP